MRLWRISNYATLDGRGGLLQSARWHTKGRPIIYTADHPASALLEILVNVDVALLPDKFQLLQIAVPDSIIAKKAAVSGNWRNDVRITRTIGDHWLAGADSLLLQVPSAVMPGIFNILINPLHPDASRLRIESAEPVPLDDRLR